MPKPTQRGKKSTDRRSQIKRLVHGSSRPPTWSKTSSAVAFALSSQLATGLGLARFHLTKQSKTIIQNDHESGKKARSSFGSDSWKKSRPSVTIKLERYFRRRIWLIAAAHKEVLSKIARFTWDGPETDNKFLRRTGSLINLSTRGFYSCLQEVQLNWRWRKKLCPMGL